MFEQRHVFQGARPGISQMHETRGREFKSHHGHIYIMILIIFQQVRKPSVFCSRFLCVPVLDKRQKELLG